jgi:hypothetical protein
LDIVAIKLEYQFPLSNNSPFTLLYIPTLESAERT